MLRSLYIQDFALINRTEIHFDSGLNIITGETGAGKSILIGALNMVLGERAQTHVVRKGAKKAVAEAHFELQKENSSQLEAILVDVEITSENHSWILRREIKDSGSRAFINDVPVSVQLLKRVGDLLVDLHGQHDHQLLLKPEFHHIIIDQNLKDATLLSSYKTDFANWSTTKSALKLLKKKQADLEQKTRLFEFQWKELEEAALYTEEEEELLLEMKRLDSAEESAQMTAFAQHLLEDEQGILTLCRKLEQYIEELGEIDPSFEAYLQDVHTAKIALAETASFLEKYSDQITFDPNRLEQLRQRHRFLRQLEKKYGMTIQELLLYKEEIQQKLKDSAGYDAQINEQEQKLQRTEKQLVESAIKLHDARCSTQKELCTAVKRRLADMGIPDAEIVMQVQYKTGQGGLNSSFGELLCDEFGADTMWFEVSMNKGEPLKPLSDIASGGEISRVMLAFKDASLNEQKIPVMVFDEIDAGISGRISEKVGGVMRKLSKKAQILAITHQPQIAAQADHHYTVRKVEEEGRVVSRIEKLRSQEHIEAVAALMSGEEITESSINSAIELIESAKKLD